ELGKRTVYTRDPSTHRVTRIDYPDHTFETFTYNGFGQVLDHQRKNGAVEHNCYDSRGLKTSFQDSEGNITYFGYDLADRLASITDARGNITFMEYNERGLLIRKTNADGSFQTFEYDEFGNRTELTDELGHTWTRLYDQFRRVVDATDPLNRTTHYDYDLPGGICRCTHAEDKPTIVTLPSGMVTMMIYDLEWQMESQTVGFGSPDAATTNYGYDLVGNQTSITEPNEPLGGPSW